MTLGGRLTRLRNAFRRHRIGLNAAGHFGRSLKLRRAGQVQEALEVARQGLILLGDPVVRRQQGPEGSGIVCLALQVEQLAHELGETGVGQRDLADSVAFLRSLPATAKGQAAEIRRDWLPYFEARLAETTRQGS